MSERTDGSDLSGQPFTFDASRKRTKGLIRLGEQWFHLSEQHPTLILRPLTEDSVEEARTQRFQLDKPEDMHKATAQLGAAIFYGGWSIDEAIEARDRILADREVPRESDPPSRIVPITRLRNYYEILRSFGSYDVCLAFLEAANRQPGKLAAMFASSYVHFSRYSNADEAFVESTAVRAPLEDTAGFARCLLVKVRDERGWSGDADLAFDFIGYEVSPIRTRNSRFEDGRPAKRSGAGGMDLLLRARDSGLPIIGEIKAKDDTNLFLALIQSLTYAVEMTTPAQRRRLTMHHGFKLDLGEHASGPFADVYLMYEEGTDPTIKRHVIELTAKLRAMHDSLLARVIRRIVFLECADGDPASLHRAFVA